jgi:hypothetical protein
MGGGEGEGAGEVAAAPKKPGSRGPEYTRRKGHRPLTLRS